MPMIFTTDELSLLKELTKDHKTLNDKFTNIEAGTYYQSHMESIKEDVLAVLENNGYDDVSEVDLERIVLRVSNYDESAYNEFIDGTISNILNGE